MMRINYIVHVLDPPPPLSISFVLLRFFCFGAAFNNKGRLVYIYTEFCHNIAFTDDWTLSVKQELPIISVFLLTHLLSETVLCPSNRSVTTRLNPVLWETCKPPNEDASAKRTNQSRQMLYMHVPATLLSKPHHLWLDKFACVTPTDHNHICGFCVSKKGLD